MFKNFYISKIVPLMSYCGKIWYSLIIRNLSNDRSKASSKAIPPHSAI